MPTILVADDNSNIQKMVSLVFKEKGIRVVAVGNGEAACRKVPEVHPDVVLADVFMPVRNGYEVCEFVKQDPEFANTPVILLVGAFDPLDEKEARRVGANGVLKKPFVPPEPLIAMVSALLGKLEPPVEEAPPAAEVAAPPPPPNPAAVYAPPVREFSPAPESADSDTGDEAVLAFGDPVATPSAKSQETDEEDDDSEPASEWARRRATMDYEIDTADSANMVEKLSAEGAAADAEILASRKHLPFGGANVPEGISEAAPEPSPVKWPHFVAPETPADEPVTEKPEQASTTEETAAPIALKNPATNSWQNQLPPQPDFAHAEEPSLPPTVIGEAPFREPVAAPAQETAAPWSADPPPVESVAHSDDAIREVASAAWSLPQIPEEPQAEFAEPEAASPEESREPEIAPSVSENQPIWHETVERMSDPPLALPEVKSYLAHEETESATTKFVAVETPTNESFSRPQVDQATVDDMVAKVLLKLEPQLHQALANGVLRPLVEELLNQERDKK
ncbi:MAG: response regulator [Candidatus Acidiferrales bacterium]